jgi:hypothetical protein
VKITKEKRREEKRREEKRRQREKWVHRFGTRQSTPDYHNYNS